MNRKKEVKPIANYGYIRVSTREQNEDRQLIALHELNIPEKNIYMDKQSGKANAGDAESQMLLAEHYYEVGEYDDAIYWYKIASCASHLLSQTRINQNEIHLYQKHYKFRL